VEPIVVGISAVLGVMSFMSVTMESVFPSVVFPRVLEKIVVMMDVEGLAEHVLETANVKMEFVLALPIVLVEVVEMMDVEDLVEHVLETANVPLLDNVYVPPFAMGFAEMMDVGALVALVLLDRVVTMGFVLVVVPTVLEKIVEMMGVVEDVALVSILKSVLTVSVHVFQVVLEIVDRMGVVARVVPVMGPMNSASMDFVHVSRIVPVGNVEMTAVGDLVEPVFLAKIVSTDFVLDAFQVVPEKSAGTTAVVDRAAVVSLDKPVPTDFVFVHPTVSEETVVTMAVAAPVAHVPATAFAPARRHAALRPA